VQNACDAAALAGARELPDKGKAFSVAKSYAKTNGVDDSYVDVTFPESNKITVTATDKPVDFFFARIMGINQGFSNAHASALVAPLSRVNGLVPFAVVDSAYTPDQTVVLKQAGGDGTGGNYQAVDLDGLTGGTVYRDTIVSGCKTFYDVNQTYTISTEPGAKNGPTRQGLETRIGTDTCTIDTYESDLDCPRVVKVPLIQTLGALDVSGRAQITIKGFDYFFIESLSVEGGNLAVEGRFIKRAGDGDADPSQTSYGAKGVILTE